MAPQLRVAAAACLVAAAAAVLPPFATVPEVPQTVLDGAGHVDANVFVEWWGDLYARGGDASHPAVRLNFEPKTVLAPTNFQMLNIVPQHARNALLASNFTQLKREFLLDHILYDSVDSASPDLTAAGAGGLVVPTYSGKEVVLRNDPERGLMVDGVPIVAQMELSDGSTLMAIDGLLFDNQEKVNVAYEDGNAINFRRSLLKEPLGPPLDLGVGFSALPPAPPTPEDLERVAHIKPIQYPPGFIFDRNAKPPAIPIEVDPDTRSPGTANQILDTSEPHKPSALLSSKDFDVGPPAMPSLSALNQSPQPLLKPALNQSPQSPLKPASAEVRRLRAPQGPPVSR